MGPANQRIAFPVKNLGSDFNVLGSLANWLSTNDPAPPEIATGIALLVFLLRAQLIPKAPASSFISVRMTLNRFMANVHLIHDLFCNSLFMQTSHRFMPK
jgi:hypothetical protein